jgi:arylsulfatase A-like enzyme
MVDDAAGQIIAAVEASGEAQDTLIIFTSDNAPNWKQQHIEMFGHHASGIYRGKKGDVHEGGHRMPFIVKWPAQVKPGSVSEHTTTQTNLMATVAELTGERMPEGAGKDSRSILTILMGGTSEPEVLVHHTSSNMFSVRDGDWKFVDGLGSGGFTKPKWIEPTPGGPSGQLFNLATDPQESENLYLKHPEIVARLRAVLNQKRK